MPSSPHQWQTVSLAWPEGTITFAVCERCYARTQYPAQFAAFGPPCLPTPTDAEIVERFLRSLGGEDAR